MITFLTLFLGLVFGPQTVEIRVGPEVARVEVRLGDEVVTELTGQPPDGVWRAAVDFGPEVVPERLTAVAFDDRGGELGRVSQPVNRPRPSAELDVSVDEAEGGGRRVLFRWEDVLGREPLGVAVAVDGVAVETVVTRPGERGGEAVVPPVDPSLPHVVRVVVELDDDSRLQREIAFGGSVVELSQDLTAVPVRLAGSPTAPLASLDSNGDTIPVLAVEEGDAVVYLVPDATARPALRLLVGRWLERRPKTRFGGSTTVLDRFGDLGKGTSLRILEPVVRRQKGAHVAFEVFPVSPPDIASTNWVELLALGADPTTDAEAGLEPTVRLADAVAVAGLRAAADHRRRAVVLLASAVEDDLGRLRAGQARRYLERLGVPLEVWSLEPDGWRRTGSGARGFEADRVIRKMEDLRGATRSLRESLGFQRIAWVSGVHRPAELRPPAGSGFEPLASSPAVPEAARDAGAEPDSLADAVRAARREAATAAVAQAPLPPRLQAARRLLGPEAADAPADWGGFRVWTDAPAAVARRLAVVAAGVSPAYRALHGGAEAAASPGNGDSLVVFADPARYRLFVDLSEGGGGARPVDRSWLGHAGDDGVAALPVSDDPGQTESLLLHEGAHLLNRHRFPGRTLPPWLEEGLAESLAFSAVGRDGGVDPERPSGEVRRAPEGHPRLERYRVTGALSALGRLAGADDLPSLRAVTSADAGIFHQSENRRIRYDLAAFLARWLSREHGDDWRRFLDAVAAGGAADLDALASFLGVLPEQVEKDFAEWVRGEARRRGVAR